jgi:hypothetical protein
VTGCRWARVHDCCNRDHFVGDWSIIFVVVKAGRIETANFPTTGDEPHSIAFYQRGTANSLQRPIVDTAGDQFFTAVLPQKLAGLFVECE